MNPRTILLADDDPDILEAMKLILQMSTYRVEVVSYAKDVLKKIKQLHPGMVLLDIKMSGVNGIDVCREVKKDKSLQSIPIVLVSASTEMKKESLKAGADDFLAKPFDMQELLSKIEKNMHSN